MWIKTTVHATYSFKYYLFKPKLIYYWERKIHLYLVQCWTDVKILVNFYKALCSCSGLTFPTNLPISRSFVACEQQTYFWSSLPFLRKMTFFSQQVKLGTWAEKTGCSRMLGPLGTASFNKTSWQTQTQAILKRSRLIIFTFKVSFAPHSDN